MSVGEESFTNTEYKLFDFLNPFPQKLSYVFQNLTVLQKFNI